MSTAPENSAPTHILAAGGILRRDGAAGPELAIVHRKRYQNSAGERGDYSLPKGKVEAAESILAAALREVHEETGCTGRVIGPPDFCEYEVSGVPKVVVYFPMICEKSEPIRDPEEVREVLWLSPRAAAARLTYPGERAIVERAFE